MFRKVNKQNLLTENMATIKELRERNRKLRIREENIKDIHNIQKEREKLERENRELERGGKPSSISRIKAAFTPTMEIEVEGKKEKRLKPGYKGFVEFGRGVKEYHSYTQGSSTGEVKGKRVYYKKIGKGRYKKVVVGKRQHRRPQNNNQSNFGYPQFGSKSNMFGQTGSLFRRTI